MNDTDNWVNTAINNAELVVNLLIKLRQSSPSSSPLPLQKNWSTRQRRSLPTKKSPETRGSPTTPLSYSGGATSVSNGGGGGEESSRVIHDGSKIIPNETTPTKRPRKKKTLVELKEDELTLLKERKQLKRHLATLQASCQKQRKENESLKKMKIDMQLQHQGLTASNNVNACKLGKKENGFVLPDLNIPAVEEY